MGNLFYGTEGWLEIAGSTWKAFRHREKEPFAGSADNSNEGNHFANFIDAIRSGKNDGLRSDIREGFYSSSLPLLANASYLTGNFRVGETGLFIR
ncbi:MAG: hypothetical protein WD266_02520 [Balneolales bacterium]